MSRSDRGFTMLKMDLGVQPLIGVPGALSWPQGMLPGDPEDKLERMLNLHTLMHPFTHVRLTPKGIALICEYVEQVRAVVGDEVPIAAEYDELGRRELEPQARRLGLGQPEHDRPGDATRGVEVGVGHELKRNRLAGSRHDPNPLRGHRRLPAPPGRCRQIDPRRHNAARADVVNHQQDVLAQAGPGRRENADQQRNHLQLLEHVSR